MGRERGSAGQRGTSVTVRKMFQTMPVRLEQMKKQRVSVAKLKRLLMSYALVREVRFQLQVRGNKKLDWTVQAASDAMGVAVSIFGKDLMMHRYTHTSYVCDGITIDAILPIPNQGRPSLPKVVKTCRHKCE
jgi:DNA mismatch repair ATPase MutL